MDSTESGPVTKAGRREWLGLIVLALPALLVSVDLSVLFLALPDLAADLQASSTQQLWILDIYGFLIAGFLVTMGTLGDRVGRRKLLLIGGAFFGAASILAAFSTSPEMLIISRAVLGIAGATLAPSTLSLIMTMFHDAKQRTTAIGVWTSCFVAGSLFGPIIGGLMLSVWWWGSVFLLAVPVMVLLLVAGPVLLPEFRNPAAGKIDIVSVGLSLVTLIPIIYGLKELARAGWETLPVVAVIVGLIAGVLFVRRQNRLEHPLLDLGLFKIPLFRNDLVLGLLIGLVTGGALLLVNLHLQLVEGLTPAQTGLWLVPSAAGIIFTIQLATKLNQKIRPAILMVLGLVVSVVGYIILTQVNATDSLATVIIGAFLANAGVGPYVALGYGILMTAAPPDKIGQASGVSATSGELGVATGIAVMGSIATVAYRSDIVIPPGLPPEAVAAAEEGIANAAAVAPQLPEAVAGQLLTAAREAFTTGLNVVGWVAMGLFTVFAAASWHWFKQMPPSGAQAAAEPPAGDDAPEVPPPGQAEAA